MIYHCGSQMRHDGEYLLTSIRLLFRKIDLEEVWNNFTLFKPWPMHVIETVYTCFSLSEVKSLGSSLPGSPESIEAVLVDVRQFLMRS